MFRTLATVEPDLERELQLLEARANEAVPGFGAQFLNRAGDLCLEARMSLRALRYYGRAIDSYLTAGRYDAAAAVCRKLLRVSPHSVRARCTLAWLAIGKGMTGDARREIEEYVHAAQRAGQQDIARAQLRLMVAATYHAGLVELIAVQLRILDDAEGAAAAERAIQHLRSVPEMHTAADEELLWEKVLEAALKTPAELRGEESWA